MTAFVTLDNVDKTYRMGEVVIHAADGVSFEIEKGEFAVILGPSGAGKTTVLNISGRHGSRNERQGAGGRRRTWRSLAAGG